MSHVTRNSSVPSSFSGHARKTNFSQRPPFFHDPNLIIHPELMEACTNLFLLEVGDGRRATRFPFGSELILISVWKLNNSFYGCAATPENKGLPSEWEWLDPSDSTFVDDPRREIESIGNVATARAPTVLVQTKCISMWVRYHMSNVKMELAKDSYVDI